MLYLGGGIPLPQLEPLDESLLQQKPNVNAVATLEKVIEIQSEPLGGTWGVLGGGWGAPGGLPSLCRGGGAQKGASHGGRESREGMGGDNTQGSPGLSLVSQGVFIVWEGSLPTGGGGLELLWPWGSQDVAPDVALQLSVGVLGVPRSVLPMGGPLRSAPSTGGFGPPSAPPSCPCVWGSQQGLGGVPRSIPWGFLGSSALPFPLRCVLSCVPPPPVVPPYGIWETPGLSLEGGSWGGRGPQVCPFNGVLGMGGVSKSVPAMNGVLGWGDL